MPFIKNERNGVTLKPLRRASFGNWMHTCLPVASVGSNFPLLMLKLCFNPEHSLKFVLSTVESRIAVWSSSYCLSFHFLICCVSARFIVPFLFFFLTNCPAGFCYKQRQPALELAKFRMPNALRWYALHDAAACWALVAVTFELCLGPLHLALLRMFRTTVG